MTTNAITSNAITRAVALARSFGLTVQGAVSLRSTNNVVVWLRPAPVVAKIGAGCNSRLALELEVALELQEHGGPVVAPAHDIPAVVHSLDGLDVTFWQYHPQPVDGEMSADRLAAGLCKLHSALERLSPALRARLPSYLQELEQARALLADSARTPALADADRTLLADTLKQLLAILSERAPPAAHVAIHGSPHSYNILQAAGEPLFIDFETTCMGPVEWDAAYLDDAARYFAVPLDRKLLWACRGMVSVWTAALCWSQVERGDMREHAEMHLENVRVNIAPQISGA